MTPDLTLIQTYLRNHQEDVHFQYYIRNELSKNPWFSQGMKERKTDFYQQMGTVFCVDMSLDGKVPPLKEGEERILIAATYDYYFKALLAIEKNPDTRRLKSFAHQTKIVAGSPLVKRTLSLCYATQDIPITDGIATPFGIDLGREESCRQIRESLPLYYPETLPDNMAGKKVLALILEGKSAREFSYENLLSSFGEEWCILMPKENFSSHKLLYCADSLLTNSSYHAASFASTRKPLLVAAYAENWFEKYCRKHYPESFVDLERTDELAEIIGEGLKKRDTAICSCLSYDVKSFSPCPSMK